nr:MAG TPA: hypothetical protein [Caudoviricetes sp.]
MLVDRMEVKPNEQSRYPIHSPHNGPVPGGQA